MKKAIATQGIELWMFVYCEAEDGTLLKGRWF